ncbi:hypothetical protein RSAG8_10920, partial [Rhizoctonia solani AG-8 WAC10335]
MHKYSAVGDLAGGKITHPVNPSIHFVSFHTVSTHVRFDLPLQVQNRHSRAIRGGAFMYSLASSP